MNKLWYIVKEDHHFGPFNENDLQKMFRENKITRKTTLLRRGVNKKIIVNDLVRKRVHVRKPEGERRPHQEFPYKNLFTKFTRIELPKTHSNKVVRTPLRKRPQRQNLDQLSKIKLMFSQNSTYIYIAIFLFVTFMSAVTIKYIYTKNSFSLERPSEVRNKTFRVFKKKLEKSFNKGMHEWDILLSKDLKKMWVGTSLLGESVVSLKFRGINKRILSNSPVEFISRIKVAENMGRLKKIKFLKGDKIIPGIYEVSIHLDRNTPSFWQKVFLPDFDVKKNSSMKILLNSHSKKTFTKELIKFNSISEKKNNAFVQDIKMKYETLMTIALRITTNLDNAQKGFRSKSQVKHMKNYFLNDYQRKYGSFFSNFVIENENKFKELTNSTSEIKNNIIAHYSSLSEIARSLGLISLDAIESFSKLGVNKKAFDPILKRYAKVMQLCKTKIQVLENTDL